MGGDILAKYMIKRNTIDKKEPDIYSQDWKGSEAFDQMREVPSLSLDEKPTARSIFIYIMNWTVIFVVVNG